MPEPEVDKLERFKEFDRAMQRMFKGIVPRPQRQKLLKQALDLRGAKDRA